MDSSESDKYAVNWNNHMIHLKEGFKKLYCTDQLTDVILYAEGKMLRAHKMLLSACSTYFQNLFKDVPDNPVIILKGVSYSTLKDLIEFIYSGEVNVESNGFNMFLEAAELLQISGLMRGDQTGQSTASNIKENSVTDKSSPEELSAEEYNSLDGKKAKTKKRKKHKSKHLDKHQSVKKTKSNETSCLIQEELSEELVEHSSEDTLLKHEPDTPLTTDESSTNLILDEGTIREMKKLVEEKRTPDGMYVCELCGKEYQQKYSLHKHLGVHTGNTTCFICNKVLSRKSHLERHLMQTHGVNQRHTGSVPESYW